MRTTILVSCPNCGYQQDQAAKCRKCGSLFAYAGKAEAPDPSAVSAKPAAGFLGSGTATPARAVEAVSWEKASPSLFLLRWSTLAILVVAIFLILHQAPPPLIDNDPMAGARLQEKLGTLEAGFAPGMHHELRLDEAELNSFLRSSLALKRDADAPKPSASPAAAPQQAQAQPQPRVPPAGAVAHAAPEQQNPAATPEADPTIEEVKSSVRDVKIALADDRVQAYVLFDFHGKDLSLILEGHLHVVNGYLRFEPTSGKLGSLPLPQSTLESAVTRLFDAPENRERMRVPLEIRDVRIENGELVVEYR
jgi:hypothetical protein